MVRAIAFDFGETLQYNPRVAMSWADHYARALAGAFSAIGRTPTSADIDQCCAVLKTYNTRLHPRVHEISSDVIFARVLGEAGSDANHITAFSSAFFAYFERNQRLYDDTLPILKWLRENAIPTGMLTDVAYGKRRDFVLDEFKRLALPMDHFAAVLTSVDVGERKPSPLGLLRLADLLGVRPEEMAYVGNEKKDIESANAAGCKSVLVFRDGSPPAWGQGITIASLLELRHPDMWG